MEYKNIDDTRILVRLDPGDEVVASLEAVAQKENIELAMVQGLGALNRVVMGVYDIAAQEFKATTLEGALEMISVTGTLDTMGTEHYSHFHISVGDENGRAYGGHLKEAVISATGEIIVTKMPGKIDRVKSEVTGLNIWKF